MGILFSTAYGLIKNANPFTDSPYYLKYWRKMVLSMGKLKTYKHASKTSSCIAVNIVDGLQLTLKIRITPVLLNKSVYFILGHKYLLLGN